MGGPDTNKVWVLIPAAGIGKRMESEIPKQYLKINDQTVIEHTLNCFMHHPDVAGIIVALNGDDPYWKRLKIDTSSKPVYTVEGGKERSESVSQALDYLSIVEQADEATWVMVHDAARPCLSQKDIDALLEIRSQNTIGGILATPVRDTMKRESASNNKQLISKTEDRTGLWHALTPQLFRLGELKQAIDTCLEKGITITDESSALEAVGETPSLVEGSGSNIKITRPDDLELAAWFLSKSL